MGEADASRYPGVSQTTWATHRQPQVHTQTIGLMEEGIQAYRMMHTDRLGKIRAQASVPLTSRSQLCITQK